MFEYFQRSWELIKASAAVLESDKELIIFPIISTIGMLIVTIAFILPLILTGGLENGNRGWTGYLTLFVFYLIQYLVVIYANSGLAGAALMRLRGGNPAVKD